MRILMISDVYFPRINGVSTSILTFRRQLRNWGHGVTLIVPDYGTAHPDDDRDIIRIPSRQVVLDPEDRLMRSGYVRNLTGQLIAENFDIVHIQTPFVAHYLGVHLAKELGVPRVKSYHTFFEEYLYHYIPFLPKQWLRFAARHFTRAQCNDVDAVVVPSTTMCEVLRRYGVTADTVVIPTGLEQDRFAKGDGEAFRRRHGIAPDRPVLAHVGRIAFEKNIDFLLRMLLHVRGERPDILLVIAGEGPALPRLRALTSRLGLQDNVLFIGYLERDSELLDCYSGGDLFVFASRTETQGLVLLEAMAQGVPVVSTALMGAKDVLRHGEGALVATEDERVFAVKVLQLLRDPQQRTLLGMKASHYANKWSAARMTENMLEFYGTIIGNRETTPLPVARQG